MSIDYLPIATVRRNVNAEGVEKKFPRRIFIFEGKKKLVIYWQWFASGKRRSIGFGHCQLSRFDDKKRKRHKFFVDSGCVMWIRLSGC